MAASASSSAAATAQFSRHGDAAFASMEKINAELLTMTYGAVVTQLIKDFREVKVVNTELEKMGYNIGIRIVDEFLAKSNVKQCASFRDTATAIAKVGFRMFLGITSDVSRWRDDGKQFSLTFRSCPLFDFVEIPSHLAGLEYGNLLCGVIRGALYQVQLVVECAYLKSELKGHSESEIRVTLKEVLRENYKEEEE